MENMKKMTNAEKLAKDTDFMISALDAHCVNQVDCFWCEFARKADNGRIVCVFATSDEADIRDQMIKWLESEVEEDAEIY